MSLKLIKFLIVLLLIILTTQLIAMYKTIYTLLIIIFSITVQAQISKSETQFFEKISASFIDRDYRPAATNLFWSLCLGEEKELTAEQLADRYKILSVDSVQRAAFYKRFNFYLSGEVNYSADLLIVCYVKNAQGVPVPVIPYNKVKQLAALINAFGQDPVMEANWKEQKILADKDSGFFDHLRKPSDTTYTLVDEPAQFPGGIPALMTFLRKHISYPETDRNNDIQGTVMISFKVCNDGYICAANKRSSVSKDLDTEALRVLKMMPHWKPGKLTNQNVATWFTLPFVFKIQ